MKVVTLRTAQAVYGFITGCLGDNLGYDIEYLQSITMEDEEIIDNDEFTLIIDRRKDGAYDVSVELFATATN